MLDLETNSSKNSFLTNSNASASVLQFACPVSMMGKQSSGIYTVGAMTKDKASSTASSTQYQGSGHVSAKVQGESQAATPTLHILKAEAKQSARSKVEGDLDRASAGTQNRLISTALTARTLTRKHLEQSKATSISSLLSGSALSQTQRANSKKNLTSTAFAGSSTSKTHLINTAQTVPPHYMNYMSVQLGPDDSQTTLGQTMQTTRPDQSKLASTSLRPSDRTCPSTKRSLLARLQLPRTTPVSANTSPVNLKDTVNTIATTIKSSGTAAASLASQPRHLRKNQDQGAKTGSQTQSQLRKLLDQVYASQRTLHEHSHHRHPPQQHLNLNQKRQPLLSARSDRRANN